MLLSVLIMQEEETFHHWAWRSTGLQAESEEDPLVHLIRIQLFPFPNTEVDQVYQVEQAVLVGLAACHHQEEAMDSIMEMNTLEEGTNFDKSHICKHSTNAITHILT